jgi:alpha-L-rhamnosidase
MLRPVELRCEYHVNPLGIDQTKPRLSWLLQSDQPQARGQKQTAYRILVASSRDELMRDQADLWDSQRVNSDETAQIEYQGKPLRSEQECWWKVQVFNGDGASSWSEPARWTMGLLDKSDWKAQWIGYDAPSEKEKLDKENWPDLTLDGCKWIWTDETQKDPHGEAPKGNRYFRKAFALPTDRRVRRATLLVTADNRFQLFVNGRSMRGGNDWHHAYARELTDRLKPGENVIAITATNDAGGAALIARLRVEFDNNSQAFTLDTDDTWKYSIDEPPKNWRTMEFDDSKWQPAGIVATFGEKPWDRVDLNPLHLPPPPYLRKSFESDKPVKRAMLYASALGVFQFYLNGTAVSDEVLMPGWTDYNKRVHYRTYDVTDRIRTGENCLGAILGDGWYAGYYSYQSKRALYGEDPRLLAQLKIEYADGSSELVCTDGSWKASYGPLQEADLLMGSAYDARKELNGPFLPWFDDSQWAAVVVDAMPSAPPLCTHPGEPIRRIEEIPAKSVTQLAADRWIFDLGQNMVGWVRLTTQNIPAGTRLTIRHAEMLSDDGELYTTSLRNARAMDAYVTKGAEREVWEPSFTFHGFRYAEVAGLSSKPPLEMITGVVIHSALEQTGTFECSNPLVNQLVHNILWGQKGNYIDIPTDCPQRDERLGWTGDAQFFIPTAAYNMDIASFFTKWLVDLDTDSQNSDGAYPSVAPDVLNGPFGATAWADAGVICPYVIYRQYGDKRIIEEHHDSMKRYVDYLHKTSKDLVRTQGAFGDWVNLGGGASSEVIGTSYFEYVTRLFAEMAQAIGREDDAAKYRKLADDIRAAFIKNFVTDDGAIKDSSQTGYALAFTMSLLPSDAMKRAAEKFVDHIAKKDWHLATGFIGTPRLLPALVAAGRADVAYRLLLTETFPSWLYQVKLGATTMWERWDGWVPEQGFQDPGMNSFNHYAFGSVGEFLYRDIAGIDAGAPGFKKIIIRPHVDPRLTYARASYKSIRGEIKSEWRLDPTTHQLTLNVTVPPNTSATVYVPTKDGERVEKVASGEYTFAGSVQ